ncbi:MAG: hypothetical protein KAF91_20395 [Nostoc sp. TH1S01]|nr:hypothetical protein [Nostoc sp. TH1S01]
MEYFTFFTLLSASLFSVIEQMRIALDEVDFESFILWAGVASVMAGLPMILW